MKHLSKQEFGRRIYTLMNAQGWHQSELARKSGLTRDSISTYINGKVFPTPQKLAKLAKALEVPPESLLPNHLESAIDADMPSFEMRVSPNAPGTAWLRVNRLVSVKTAVRIADLLQEDDVIDGSRSRTGA